MLVYTYYNFKNESFRTRKLLRSHKGSSSVPSHNRAATEASQPRIGPWLGFVNQKVVSTAAAYRQSGRHFGGLACQKSTVVAFYKCHQGRQSHCGGQRHQIQDNIFQITSPRPSFLRHTLRSEVFEGLRSCKNLIFENSKIKVQTINSTFFSIN